VIYAFINKHRTTWPIVTMCRVLDVSRSGYFDWINRPPSQREQRRDELAEKIQVVHDDSDQIYGSPRVHKTLVAQGQTVSENTVARVMRETQIRSKMQKKFRPRTTDSNHDLAVAPNHLDRDFAAEKPDQKWVADITYVRTDEGWLYLAAVMDLCSRKIVGWSMADHMQAELINDALLMAVERRGLEAGRDVADDQRLMCHSDRGSQYASVSHQSLLNAFGIVCSMSGAGNCYDNAVIESFWATLKKERIYRERYATNDAARASIFEYVEVFYNRKRLHSTLGYMSPEAFEASLN
jgi:transposase InsO family protein